MSLENEIQDSKDEIERLKREINSLESEEFYEVFNRFNQNNSSENKLPLCYHKTTVFSMDMNSILDNRFHNYYF